MLSKRIIFGLFLVLSTISAVSQAQTTIYVDENAPGDNDGSTWHHAYRELSTAISAAGLGTIIKVADGVYSPGPSQYDSFLLEDGLAIYGGFAGYGAIDPDVRDWLLYTTVLDGQNINYHVVKGSDISPSAMIDGFTITGGRADGDFPDDSGGGILISAGDPIIVNCKVIDNHAKTTGGGMATLSDSRPWISDCTFHGNTSGEYGGGVSCNSSNPTFYHCTFSANVADTNGGAMYNTWMTNAVLERCTFFNNQALGTEAGTGFGGGICSVFINKVTALSCAFVENYALDSGGGINVGSASTLIAGNCTFYGNAASTGGGINNGSSGITTVTNSILWANSPDNILDLAIPPATPANVTFNCIEGGFEGDGSEGNIATDPCFVNPANYDFHLTQSSPCINRGVHVIAEGDLGVTDDVLAPTRDLEGDPRPFIGSQDMGMDEYTGLHYLASEGSVIIQNLQSSIQLDLEAGPTLGGQWYCIFGSLKGTVPGVVLPGGMATLPITLDTFTDQALARVNTPLFTNFLGQLNGNGHAVAWVVSGPDFFPPTWIDRTLFFAFTVDSFTLASNPIEIRIEL